MQIELKTHCLIRLFAPIGICGSGLVELIALLLDAGLIEGSGRFCKNSYHPLASRLRTEQQFVLTDQITLSQEDIRQFQLAKAAVNAGILTLCDLAGVAVSDIEICYLTGGLGYYIPHNSAFRTGLIPECLSGKLRSVGNSSLAGAVQCLLPELREQASRSAKAIRVCQINHTAEFSDYFIDNLLFAQAKHSAGKLS